MHSSPTGMILRRRTQTGRFLTGAEVVGSEDLIANIQKGGASAIDFDKCLATSAMMSKLGRIARTLGPRGLMPNPKLGTIVESSNITEAIRTMKAGRVEFRCAFQLCCCCVVSAAVSHVSFAIQNLAVRMGPLPWTWRPFNNVAQCTLLQVEAYKGTVQTA